VIIDKGGTATFEHLLALFGPEIAGIVQEVLPKGIKAGLHDFYEGIDFNIPSSLHRITPKPPKYSKTKNR
jgi:hypothetical protein